VLTCFAAQATGRSASSITPKPIVIRSVTAAAVASTTSASRMGALATRWSVDQTESSPASSANRALARTSPMIGCDGSGVDTGSITPILIATPAGNARPNRAVSGGSQSILSIYMMELSSYRHGSDEQGGARS
jgi:hypothetical protein